MRIDILISATPGLSFPVFKIEPPLVLHLRHDGVNRTIENR